MTDPQAPAASSPTQSPPPMPAPVRETVDRSVELRELAGQLSQKSDRRLLTQFLRLRRSLRGSAAK